MSIPRRAYLDKLTPKELKIREAMDAVEGLGANILKTIISASLPNSQWEELEEKGFIEQ